MKKIEDIRFELFDTFVEENWFYDVKIVEINDVENQCYMINLIVYESFSIWDFNDVKNELKYLGFEVYDDVNLCIIKRDGKDTYSFNFQVKGVRE